MTGPRAAALGLLAASAALIWSTHAARGSAGPSAGAALAAAAVPTQVGAWTGSPLSVEARVTDLLETPDVSLMEYRRPGGQPVWFAQVAGFGNRAAFHPPELCYVGSHFEVLERRAIAVASPRGTRRVMRLVIAQDRARYEAWYWFTAGARITPSYYQQQWWLLLAAVQARPLSGTLVRLSTPLEEPSAAHRRLAEFLTAWEARDPA